MYATRPEMTLPSPPLQRTSASILRCGFEQQLTIIDLRFICSEESDYANPIEPSGSGGFKIAKSIAGWLGVGESAAVSRVRTS